jgi:hypothetical protein
MPEKKGADVYFKYLTDQGYRPEYDKDGDVSFKKEGGTYLIMVDEKDEQFFQLAYPNFWPLKSDEERKRALEASNFANTKTKVTKVSVTANNNVWANIELFVAKREDFIPVLDRALSAIGTGIKRFAEKMKEGEPPAT